jgi:hypothetical protein
MSTFVWPECGHLAGRFAGLSAAVLQVQLTQLLVSHERRKATDPITHAFQLCCKLPVLKGKLTSDLIKPFWRHASSQQTRDVSLLCVEPTVPRGAGITRAADPCLQNPHGVFRTALVVSPERSGLALAVRPAGPAEAPGSTARRRRVPLAGCEAPLRMEGPTRTMHGVPVPVTVASPAMTQLTRRRRAPAQRA